MSQVRHEYSESNRYAAIVADSELTAWQAVSAILKEYARERPDVVAYCSFGVGFLLGWKLKFW